ncbi:MAG TPA: heavy metal sensor histidine kinase [Rhodocyclaceae bacterium]|nr:heavy metal sensor histidine kinase [Rhodocyclaceae bacterium]
MRLIAGRSITFRLTVLFAAISSAVLLLLGLLIGALAERHFEELDMELLGGKLELLQHALEKVRNEREFATLPQQLDDSLVGHHGLAVMVLAADGRVVFSSGEADFPPALRSVDTGSLSAPAIWTNRAGHRLRGVSTAVRIPPDAAPTIVAVATNIATHERFMRSFQIALWAVVGAAMLASGVLGWIAARWGLAPLEAIRHSAAAITASRLDQRLDGGAIPLELAAVVDTLNGMLARLQDSFRRLSDFSSDLAHELRTPVGNLSIQTQVTLAKNRTPEEYRNVLASNAEELERLSRTIADMLFLAKADNALIVPQRETIELQREVAELFEFYEALAEERQIRLSLTGAATVAGDRLMLRRAIGNLLSNAFRHTPHDGRIDVAIVVDSDRRETATVSLSVENTGETIPAEHLPRLFDRFYRADASRHHLTEGAGLGLAIARSIVRAHGGDIDVRSANGVTTFELRLAP